MSNSPSSFETKQTKGRLDGLWTGSMFAGLEIDRVVSHHV